MKYYIYFDEFFNVQRISDSKDLLSADSFNEIVYDSVITDFNEFTSSLSNLFLTNDFKLLVLRTIRDKLLHASDSQYIEALTKNKKEQDVKNYKQALRDIPNVADINGTTLNNILSLFPAAPIID